MKLTHDQEMRQIAREAVWMGRPVLFWSENFIGPRLGFITGVAEDADKVHLVIFPNHGKDQYGISKFPFEQPLELGNIIILSALAHPVAKEGLMEWCSLLPTTWAAIPFETHGILDLEAMEVMYGQAGGGTQVMAPAKNKGGRPKGSKTKKKASR